jgi:hypothetical protein
MQEGLQEKWDVFEEEQIDGGPRSKTFVLHSMAPLLLRALCLDHMNMIQTQFI